MTAADSIAELEARAAAGDAEAAFALYHSYARGSDITRDVEKARAFLRQSAAAGHVPALLMLGQVVYGASKEEALVHFLAAAALGDAMGQLRAGQMLFGGRFRGARRAARPRAPRRRRRAG